jgi:hypothetical protein
MRQLCLPINTVGHNACVNHATLFTRPQPDQKFIGAADKEKRGVYVELLLSNGSSEPKEKLLSATLGVLWLRVSMAR